jgi:peptidoglycan/xylan/chitin deacetylase (PgdA/CDA1 family)
MLHKKLVLMLHECRREFTELPLKDYVLTFDDGLYSQFIFHSDIQYIPTPKIFFISTDIVCNGTQSLEFPKCSAAHQKAFAGNKEDYMTLAQIKTLLQDPWVTIGAHSHSHTRLSHFKTLAEKVAYIQKDTVLMLDWFKTNLDFSPTSFCFPYNEDLDGLYRGLLKKHGFTEFYGGERIPVETLLHTQNQLESHDTLPAWSLPRRF